MLWTREQYLDLMTFGDTPRPMFCELFGPLAGLEDRWRAQGASEDEVALTAFDWDYVAVVGCGAHSGPIHTPAPVVLEDTPRVRIERDHLGRVTKLCKDTATIPLPLDFPVKDTDDWLKLKHHYAWSPDRIDHDALEKARKLQQKGHLVVFGMPGGFDTARELMGEEVACMAYYLQPELMHDILDTLAETCVRLLETVTKIVTPDQVSVHEDMAGRTGPLAGPDQIREFIGPYYRAVWDMASSSGTRLFCQDSDGDMTPVVDAFLETGLNVMYPCEPAAGMDMAALRKKYGARLAFKGGIDKHVLRQSPADIDRELEYKIQDTTRTGVVFALDHRIPNGTPLENYRYYVKKGREMLGLPPLDGTRRGWQRMAF